MGWPGRHEPRPDPDPHRRGGPGRDRQAGAARGDGCRQAADPGAGGRGGPWPAIWSSTAARPTSSWARPSPSAPGYTVMTLREPHGVTGHIIPWNYPMQIIGRSVIAALATGNAVGVEAGGGGQPHRPGLRPDRHGRWAARRRAETSCRGWARTLARLCPGIRTSTTSPLPVRRAVGRADPDGGGGASGAGDARTGRQVRAGRVRRRGPGCGPAVSGQCRHPERRPDLFGRLAHPGAARRVRGSARPAGGALSCLAGRAGGGRSGGRAVDLGQAAPDRAGAISTWSARRAPRLWRAAMSCPPPHPAATISRRPCWRASSRWTGWRRRKSSAPCRW